jgi:hypothetical protein
LCCYKILEEQKVPYLQGGLIFKQHPHDQIWLKYHLYNHAMWFLMKGYENQLVQYCIKNFN